MADQGAAKRLPSLDAGVDAALRRKDRAAATTPLNEGVRRGIEDARDTAARNVEYLDKEIAKAEREQDRLTERIAEMREELARNAATLDEAEEMLNGR